MDEEHGEKVTQSEVGDVSEMSGVTIRNRGRELLEAADATDPA